MSGDAVIDGAGLRESYKAVEVHFHWGKNGGPGSEHTIDGEQYPMEVSLSLCDSQPQYVCRQIYIQYSIVATLV